MTTRSAIPAITEFQSVMDQNALGSSGPKKSKPRANAQMIIVDSLTRLLARFFKRDTPIRYAHLILRRSGVGETVFGGGLTYSEFCSSPPRASASHAAAVYKQLFEPRAARHRHRFRAFVVSIPSRALVAASREHFVFAPKDWSLFSQDIRSQYDAWKRLYHAPVAREIG